MHNHRELKKYLPVVFVPLSTSKRNTHKFTKSVCDIWRLDHLTNVTDDWVVGECVWCLFYNMAAWDRRICCFYRTIPNRSVSFFYGFQRGSVFAGRGGFGWFFYRSFFSSILFRWISYCWRSSRSYLDGISGLVRLVRRLWRFLMLLPWMSLRISIIINLLLRNYSFWRLLIRRIFLIWDNQVFFDILLFTGKGNFDIFT